MSTPTAMRNTWTFPLKWLAAPSSASTNFSASLRASSLTPTSSPGISRPVSSTRLSVTAFSRSCEGLPPPHLSCSPPDSPGRQGNVRQPERDMVAGIAQSEERDPPAAKGQCLCSFHGHPEHDRPHRPVHGVERPGVAESEVLQDRPAFAADAGQDQFPARAHRELLNHRLAVDGVLVCDGERIPRIYGVPGDDPLPGVLEFEDGRRPEEEYRPRGGKEQEGQPPRHAHAGSGPLHALLREIHKGPGMERNG